MANYRDVDRLNKRIKALYNTFGKSNTQYKYIESYLTTQSRQYGYKVSRNKQGIIQISKGKKNLETIPNANIVKLLAMPKVSEKIKEEVNKGLTKDDAIKQVKFGDTVKGFINSHLGEIYADPVMYALVKRKERLTEEEFIYIVQNVGSPKDIGEYKEIFSDERIIK